MRSLKKPGNVVKTGQTKQKSDKDGMNSKHAWQPAEIVSTALGLKLELHHLLNVRY